MTYPTTEETHAAVLEAFEIARERTQRGGLRLMSMDIVQIAGERKVKITLGSHPEGYLPLEGDTFERRNLLVAIRRTRHLLTLPGWHASMEVRWYGVPVRVAFAEVA